MERHASRHSKGRGRPPKFDLTSLICRSNIKDIFSMDLWNLIEPHEQQRLMQYLPECDLITETISPSKIEESIEVEMEEEKEEAAAAEEEEEEEEEEMVEVEHLDCEKEQTCIPTITISPPKVEEEIDIEENQDEKEGGLLCLQNDPLGLWNTLSNLESMDTKQDIDNVEEKIKNGEKEENEVHPVPFSDLNEKQDEKMEEDMKGQVEKRNVQVVEEEEEGEEEKPSSFLVPPSLNDPNSMVIISEPSMVDNSFSSLTTLNSSTLPELTKTSIRPHIFSTPAFRQSFLTFQDYFITGRLTKVLESCNYESKLSIAELPFMKKRMEGEEGLDDEEWKDTNFESYWGQLSEQKKQFRNSQVAGESAQIKLRDLIAKGMLKANDILSYEKWFEVIKQVVREEYKILHVSADSDTLHARHIATDEEYTFAGLNHLETVTFREAAGSAGIRKPNGNAWKCTIRKRPKHPNVSFFQLRKEYMALYLTDDH